MVQQDQWAQQVNQDRQVEEVCLETMDPQVPKVNLENEDPQDP